MIVLIPTIFLMFIGKNTFAMSVLRRIEMKLDGQDISEKRYLHYLHLVFTWNAC